MNILCNDHMSGLKIFAIMGIIFFSIMGYNRLNADILKNKSYYDIMILNKLKTMICIFHVQMKLLKSQMVIYYHNMNIEIILYGC
jgi:hypothetical protein